MELRGAKKRKQSEGQHRSTKSVRIQSPPSSPTSSNSPAEVQQDGDVTPAADPKADPKAAGNQFGRAGH